MCMEDIRIMRETAANDGVVAVAGLVVPFLKQSKSRVALLIQNIGTNPISVGLTNNVALGAGLNLPVGGSPVLMDIQKHGDIVTRGMFAIAAGGAASSIYFMESTLEKT
jgi:hypothetical protein